MSKYFSFIAIGVLVLFISLTKSEPGFNGTAPGCGGSGCHSSQSGIVTTEVLSNFQVRITVSGTTSKVAGELVDAQGNVVAVNNSTSNNPFILTAPGAGTYTVNAGYKNPSLRWSSTSVIINTTGIDEELIGLAPANFELYSNYPNPFNPTTNISYAVSETAFTTLKVYSLSGEEVLTLVNEVKTPGIYELHFDAGNLASGTYFYKLQVGDPSTGSGQSFVQTKKMLLIK